MFNTKGLPKIDTSKYDSKNVHELWKLIRQNGGGGGGNAAKAGAGGGEELSNISSIVGLMIKRVDNNEKTLK